MSEAPKLDPRLTPARADLAAEHLRGRVHAERFVAGEACVVVASSAPLRRAPVPDASLDSELLLGERFVVYERHEGFAWGQAEDGYVGYVPEARLAPPAAAPTHRVAALGTPLLPAPNLKRPALDILPLGARLAVSGGADEKGWVRTVALGHPGFGAGYAFAGHLRPLEGDGATEHDAVALAELLLGTPYIWGGRTRLGLDCSALVQLTLAARGLAAPRDSDMLEAFLPHALPVGDGLEGLRRGDVVFWRGHCGVMRDAETLIHANAHHMAVASEPLREARDRILARSFGPITSIRRP